MTKREKRRVWWMKRCEDAKKLLKFFKHLHLDFGPYDNINLWEVPLDYMRQVITEGSCDPQSSTLLRKYLSAVEALDPKERAKGRWWMKEVAPTFVQFNSYCGGAGAFPAMQDCCSNQT